MQTDTHASEPSAEAEQSEESDVEESEEFLQGRTRWASRPTSPRG